MSGDRVQEATTRLLVLIQRAHGLYWKFRAISQAPRDVRAWRKLTKPYRPSVALAMAEWNATNPDYQSAGTSKDEIQRLVEEWVKLAADFSPAALTDTMDRPHDAPPDRWSVKVRVAISLITHSLPADEGGYLLLLRTLRTQPDVGWLPQFQRHIDELARLTTALMIVANIPGGVSNLTSGAPHQVHSGALAILKRLGESRSRLTLESLKNEECSDVKTIGRHVRELLNLKMVERPNGKKSGLAITNAGRGFLASITR